MVAAALCFSLLVGMAFSVPVAPRLSRRDSLEYGLEQQYNCASDSDVRGTDVSSLTANDQRLSTESKL